MMGGSYSERSDATPNKRQRDEWDDLKERNKDRKRPILDKAPPEITESRSAPIKRSTDQPGKKSPAILQGIQTINGDGEQILPTVAIEIATFRNNAAVFLKSGLCHISDRAWGNALGGTLIWLI